MARTLIRHARILTLRSVRYPKRGRALNDLSPIELGSVIIEDDRIDAVLADQPDAGDDAFDTVLDANGQVLLPAFVDCHTHACWAGDRFDEFEMKQRGATYLQLLERGGGIMSTVRATRRASEDELREGLLRRLERMASLGTGTAEVKSGYGLDTDTELRMLRAIVAAGEQLPMIVQPTFLGAHALDPENPHSVEQTISDTLPKVASEFPGITCDAYCEEGAWSLKQVRRLFEEAQALGLPLRVHADQFNSLGATRLAIEAGARSVDHLEAARPDDLEHLARSDTMGVALPASGFHLDDRYAPGRSFVDANGALAIATNYNPGSAPTPSLPFVIALAVRKLGLSFAEAINGATINAACVLGRQEEVGTIEIGKRADLQLLDARDERELGYEFATAGPQLLMLAGRVVHQRPRMGMPRSGA